MAAFLISVAAILGFIGYCFFADSDWKGVNGSFWYVMCRLLAKHIKLAFKLAFWFIVAGAFIFGSLATAAEGSSNIHVGGGSRMPAGGGPESEKFYRTMNRATAPLRWAVDGFVSMCGALAMLVAIFVVGNTGPLPVWKAQTSFGQGYTIYDGSHVQEVEALAYSPRYPTTGECPATGGTAPAFDHSGGRTRDGGITWLDLGTPDEARRNYPDTDIPSTSFWGAGILGEYQQHQRFGNLILLALYLLWLWVTASGVVLDEYSNRSGSACTLLALAVIGAWAAFVLAAAWGVHWLFAGASG